MKRVTAKQQARREIAEFTDNCSKEYKRQRKQVEPSQQLQRFEEEILEDDAEVWLEKHALKKDARYTAAQRRQLRAFFDTLDRDGSGEIGVREMAQPLLATGIAMSTLEVAQLVRLADKDASGEVGFQEFMAAARGGNNGNSSKIIKLQAITSSGHMGMAVSVSMERRKLLLKAIVDTAQVNERAADEIERRWDRATELNDTAAAEQVYKDLQAQLRRGKRVNEYVNAVEKMTDFKQEMRDIAAQRTAAGTAH